MKITHSVHPSGHYLNIVTESSTMSVRTENGKHCELVARAEEIEKQAASYARRAETMRQAAEQMVNEVNK